jgi:hypothetical protein
MDSRKIAQWRYDQIEELLEETLTRHERGALLRESARVPVRWPSGAERPISAATLYRWVRRYLKGKTDALYPKDAATGDGTAASSDRPLSVRWRCFARSQGVSPRFRATGSAALEISFASRASRSIPPGNWQRSGAPLTSPHTPRGMPARNLVFSRWIR